MTQNFYKVAGGEDQKMFVSLFYLFCLFVYSLLRDM